MGRGAQELRGQRKPLKTNPLPWRPPPGGDGGDYLEVETSTFLPVWTGHDEWQRECARDAGIYQVQFLGYVEGWIHLAGVRREE